MSDEITDVGVGPALGDAGPNPTFRCGNQTWQVGHPTQKAKVVLELLTVEQAQANIDALRPVLRRGQYDAKCSALDLQIEGGHHKTGGALWSSLAGGPDGTAMFLCSLMRDPHPDVTVEQAKMFLADPQAGRMVRRALALTVPGFFLLIAQSLPIAPENRAEQVAQMVADFLAAIGEPPAASSASAPSGSTTA